MFVNIHDKSIDIRHYFSRRELLYRNNTMRRTIIIYKTAKPTLWYIVSSSSDVYDFAFESLEEIKLHASYSDCILPVFVPHFRLIIYGPLTLMF